MIKAIGLRRLLPILNVLLYLAVICFTNPDTAASAQARVNQLDRIPVGTRLIIAANVPAVLLAFALNATVLHLQPTRLFLLAAPFVLLLWYPVGFWFDRRLGWIASNRPIRTFLRDSFLASQVLIAVLAIVIFVQVIKRGSPGPPDRFWMSYGVCAWFAFLLAVLATKLYARFSRG